MHIKAVLIFFLVFVANTDLHSQQNGPDSTNVYRVNEYLISLDHLAQDAFGTKEKDFEFLDSLIYSFDKSKVIAFGEPTHGDGTAFVVRDRITKRIRTKKEKTILVLEGLGVFDSPSSIIKDHTAWMWSGSKQAQPGLQLFLKEDNKNSLLVSGLDIQHKSVDSLFKETQKVLKETGVLDNQWSLVHKALELKFRQPFKPVNEDTLKIVFGATDEYIQNLKKVGKAETALFLENAKANAMTSFKRSMEPRDLQMAQNLLYITQKVDADRQVIVWGATSHVIKSLSAIDNLSANWSYEDMVSMGEKVHKQLKDNYYVIAFSACSGSYGAKHLGLKEKKIAPPVAGSLEDVICSADFEYAAFLDLRRFSNTATGDWLKKPLLARPLGYDFKKASWPSVVDAFIVIRHMEPSIPLN